MAEEAFDLDDAEESSGSAQRGRFDLSVNSGDLGRSDSLRNVVLTLVVDRHYDRANQQIDDFVEAKRDFPQFKARVIRFVQHSHDLINAIKAKKNLPGASSLSMSKQQELHERSLQHFDELKRMLKTIEQVEKEMRLEDVRSTVWVIKAAMFSALVIVAVAFLHEFSSSTFYSARIVIDRYATDLINFIFDRFQL